MLNFLVIKNRYSLSVIFCFFILVITETSAQKLAKISEITFDTSATYLIKLKDESLFTGRFIEKKDSVYIFSSKSTKIEVVISDIESVSVVDPSRFVKGKYWFPNPHHTRYLFSPSAFNLKKGDGYYQNTYGVINSLNYGLSDHFTIGAGTELISLFNGTPILVMTPKFGGYDIGNKLKVGGGAFLAVAEEGIFGIGYGIVTKGTEDKNITFGLGWAFSSEGELETKPVGTISGMIRFRKNIAFISENWLIPFDGYRPFFSYGLRFFGERMSVDLALINSPEIASEAIAIGIPFVDFVYKF